MSTDTIEEYRTIPPPPGHDRWTATLADEVYPYEMRREVIDGVLWVPVTGPSRPHQLAIMLIIEQLLQQRPVGWVVLPPDTDVLDALDNVVQPDVVALRAEHYDPAADVDAITEHLALIVEVASPSTRRRDATAKRRIYDGHGVQAVWLVDPKTQTVTILERVDGALTETQATEPGQPWTVSVPFAATLSW